MPGVRLDLATPAGEGLLKRGHDHRGIIRAANEALQHTTEALGGMIVPIAV